MNCLKGLVDFGVKWLSFAIKGDEYSGSWKHRLHPL